MKNILKELNLNNSTNYKIQILKKYKDNETFKKLLQLTYDKARFTFGITTKNINVTSHKSTLTLQEALDILEKEFCTRKVTGNRAIERLTEILTNLSKDDAEILEKILDRDLKVNINAKSINKVFKNLIKKPQYMRCEIGTKENILKNIDFNKIVYSQVKMDGEYRAAILDDNIKFISRSGKEDDFPLIRQELELLKTVLSDVALTGELTLKGEKSRMKGNGLINSKNPPHELIIYTVWDAIPLNEYSQKRGTTKYIERFKRLENALKQFNFKYVQLIDYKIVKNLREVYEHFQEVTKQGLEGTVVKSEDLQWFDGTSKQQLKVKLEIELDMRLIGFVEGKKGTKREKTFGSIIFENDEKTIRGQCSGFTDEELEEINNNREKYIGKVFTVTCNDITKAKNKDYYALSHPRFKEFRDKDNTDTLERALEIKKLSTEVNT